MSDSIHQKVRVTQYEVMEDVTDQAQKFAPVYRTKLDPDAEDYEYLVTVRADGADRDGPVTKTYRLRAFDDEVAAAQGVNEAAGDPDFYSAFEDDFEVLSTKVVDEIEDAKRFRVVLKALAPGLSGYEYKTFDLLEEEGAGNAAEVALTLWDRFDAEVASVTEL